MIYMYLIIDECFHLVIAIFITLASQFIFLFAVNKHLTRSDIEINVNLARTQTVIGLFLTA